MQTTTLFTLIIAGLVLALIGLASYSRRTAESARADGYDEGYDDAKLAATKRITSLNSDIDRLREQKASARVAHGHQLEAIMQDCDERIAIHASRSNPFGVADRLALADINAMLKLAANTFAGLQANDSAVRARDLMSQIQDMDRRLVATLPAPDTIHWVAANSSPNGKSWLVYGPQACGKTRNARAIADALGLPDILDDWHPGMPVPATKTLVLTYETGPFQQFTRRVLSFEQAMSLVTSKQGAAA